MSYGNTSFRQFWVIISFIGATFAQPDLRFHPFDFVQYRKPGQVNSISFSDQYAYIGTHHGGVQRFNIFSNRVILMSDKFWSYAFDFGPFVRSFVRSYHAHCVVTSAISC